METPYKRKVFVVGDRSNCRQLARKHLSKANNQEIFYFYKEESSIIELMKFAPDLILCDNYMINCS